MGKKSKPVGERKANKSEKLLDGVAEILRADFIGADEYYSYHGIPVPLGIDPATGKPMATYYRQARAVLKHLKMIRE